MLLSNGLKVMDLPGESVLRAQHVVSDMPHLSIHDGFAFALAEMCPGCILLSGDGGLRTLAKEHDIEVRGVLWVMDEIYRNRLADVEDILTVLRLFTGDPTIRLPRRLLGAYVKRYETMD